MIFTIIKAAIVSAVASLAVIAAFAVLSGPALSPSRITAVIQQAFARGDLPWSERRDEDFFTECAMLQMQLLRPESAWQQAIDTKFRMTAGEHPCDTLRISVSGSPEQKVTLAPVQSYYHYPYGARHIEAFVLSALSYRRAARLYKILSYGSLALLLAAMIRRDRSTALMLAPIPIVLALAFALHKFGGNLAHAPGYILGWLALAGFVAAKPWFQPFPRRIAFFVAMGFITIYTDLLAGTIPTLLAMTIVLNHFFYVAERRDRYLARTAANVLVIVACFLAAWAILNGLRLETLVAEGITDQGRSIFGMYRHDLAARTGSDVGIGAPLTYAQTMVHLLTARSQVTPGGEAVASWILGNGLICWMFAGWAWLLIGARDRWEALPPLTDMLVLLIASLGVMAWYWLFLQHTYVHVLFMVRLLALPSALGYSAVLLMLRGQGAIRRGPTALRDSMQWKSVGGFKFRRKHQSRFQHVPRWPLCPAGRRKPRRALRSCGACAAVS